MNDNIEDNVYIDELNRLKLINANVSESSQTLKNETSEFVVKVDKFFESAKFLIDSMKELGKTVDLARLKALETRNALRNSDNEKLNEQQQLRILIRQKQIELERLKDEADSLRQIESQQKELKGKLQSSL
ncbi:Intraflagellar transport protein 20 homolog [Strongyloides ratti]|uniref:Intraflagellar transport protein 20 homolog n=1 Tax=Strongyloides ratti TaxID=34506 RepID=A0A090MZM6_STRRB|nr:Intraflagellar transport protein 20 homolog [Strongyloides ratti]CEF69199.1 Intraflagellar transport protein 20 homolog [Strongyloides ratti]